MIISVFCFTVRIWLKISSLFYSKNIKGKKHNVRLMSIPGGGVSKAVYFPIVPTKIGDVMLSVMAQSAIAGDAVEQVLRVEVYHHIFLAYY